MVSSEVLGEEADEGIVHDIKGEDLAVEGPAPQDYEEDEEIEKVEAGFEELDGVESFAEREPGEVMGVLALKDDSKRRLALPPVAAARHEAADPAEPVSQSQGRAGQVGHLPGRDAAAAEIPDGEDDTEGESALENPARAGQAEQPARILHIVGEIADEQDELGTEERDEDDVEAGIDDPRCIEPLLLRLGIKEPEAEAHSQRPPRSRRYGGSAGRFGRGWGTCGFPYQKL